MRWFVNGIMGLSTLLYPLAVFFRQRLFRALENSRAIDCIAAGQTGGQLFAETLEHAVIGCRHRLLSICNVEQSTKHIAVLPDPGQRLDAAHFRLEPVFAAQFD